MAPCNHAVRNGDPQPNLAVQHTFHQKACISSISREVIIAELLQQTVEVSGRVTKRCILDSVLISIHGIKLVTAGKVFRDQVFKWRIFQKNVPQ